MFFSRGIKCNEKSPSKTNFSGFFLQITAALGLVLTKSAMAVARGGLSDFCIDLVNSNRAGGYAHRSCSVSCLVHAFSFEKAFLNQTLFLLICLFPHGIYGCYSLWQRSLGFHRKQHWDS